MVHRISPEEASYKLVKVKRLQVGKGGVPYIGTHDGRTIRYPDPDIRVCLPPLPAHNQFRSAGLHVMACSASNGGCTNGSVKSTHPPPPISLDFHSEATPIHDVPEPLWNAPLPSLGVQGCADGGFCPSPRTVSRK